LPEAPTLEKGGNITGFSFLDYSVVEKSLELLKEVAPGIARVAVMFNPETYAPRLRARVASSPRT
jgi:ABC-type uncharacterized transport system substrate-binding protein